MTFLKRISAMLIGLIGALGLLGTVIDNDPLGKKVALSVFFLLMIGGAVAIWLSAQRADSKRRERNEVQRLLAMVGDQGTLAAPQLVAAGYTKEEADAALQRLREAGVVQFDVDDTGTPVYRVHAAALEARKRKTW